MTVTTAPGDELAFTPDEVSVPSGKRVHVTFTNGSAVAHNMVFTSGIDASTPTIVAPGESAGFAVKPGGPGSYPFVCTIHDGMHGTLIVTGATASR